jgi:hypothetical protein
MSTCIGLYRNRHAGMVIREIHRFFPAVSRFTVIHYTRSPFITWLSRRAQSGRRTSFGRLWFIESHIVLVIFFLLIYLFILDIKRRVVIQLNN